MSLSMFQASVPVCLQTLSALGGVLTKAEAHAAAHKIDPAALLLARLYPNMFTCAKQVQVAADFAKGGCARLAGAEPPNFPDTETSFAELRDRLDRTAAFLGTLTAAQIDGSEDRDVSVKLGPTVKVFKGQVYLLHFVLPNVYFHATAAYDILRHNGVELGKRDFMGAVPGM